MGRVIASGIAGASYEELDGVANLTVVEVPAAFKAAVRRPIATAT